MNRLKAFGECPCGCADENKYRSRAWADGLTHTRTCVCKRCTQGGHSKRGNREQRGVAKSMGVPLAGLGPGREQDWRGCWRVEVKADHAAKKVGDFYRSTKLQADKDKSLGDLRPYVAVAVVDSRQYVVIDLNDMDNATEAWASRTL